MEIVFFPFFAHTLAYNVVAYKCKAFGKALSDIITGCFYIHMLDMVLTPLNICKIVTEYLH